MSVIERKITITEVDLMKIKSSLSSMQLEIASLHGDQKQRVEFPVKDNKIMNNTEGNIYVILNLILSTLYLYFN